MAVYGTGVYGTHTYGATPPVGLGFVSISGTSSAVASSLEGTAVLGSVGVTGVSLTATVLSSDAAPVSTDVWPTTCVDLGLQSGSGSLTLDDNPLGQLNHHPLADDLGFAWTDVTEWVLEPKKLGYQRGASKNRGPYFATQSGRLTFSLDNQDGRFDPENLSGPYVSGGVTALRPNLPVRVRAVYNDADETLFMGRVTDWKPSYMQAGLVSQVGVQASDPVAELQSADPPAGLAASGQEPQDRINAILDHADWPSSRRVIGWDQDWITCQSSELTGPAWGQMVDVAESGAGYLFVDRRGNVVYRSHAGYPREPQVSFAAGDSDNAIPFRNLVTSYDHRQVWDTVKLKRDNTTNTMVVEDPDTRAANGGVRRTHSKTGLVCDLNTQVRRVAAYLLEQWRDMAPQVEQFEVMLTDSSPSWHWLSMMRLELLTHVDIAYDTPDGRTVTRAGLVRGISLKRAASEWRWTVSLFKAPVPGGDFTLDDSVLGLLDSGVLAGF